jgi:hypothetical protein
LGGCRASTAQRQGPRRVYPGPSSRTLHHGPRLRGLHVPGVQKDHLRSAGAQRLPCRITFHKYIWLLKETGAIVFDGAEAISFSDEPPQDLPPDYEPSCGTPAPRHYYRLVDPQSPAFLAAIVPSPASPETPLIVDSGPDPKLHKDVSVSFPSFPSPPELVWRHLTPICFRTPARMSPIDFNLSQFIFSAITVKYSMHLKDNNIY